MACLVFQIRHGQRFLKNEIVCRKTRWTKKKKNPEMVYQTVDGKLYFREGGKLGVYEKNSTEKEKITSDVVSFLVYNGKNLLYDSLSNVW